MTAVSIRTRARNSDKESGSEVHLSTPYGDTAKGWQTSALSTLPMPSLTRPTMWARFSGGTTIRIWPGAEPSIIAEAPLFGMTEPMFRMAVNSIDADVNEQVDY